MGGIIDHRVAEYVVPGDVLFRAALRQEITLGEQAAIIHTHQQRAIRPVANEFLIVPAALNHHVGNTQRQRGIRARPHLQPHIRLFGDSGPARIDHDQAPRV